MDVSGGCYLCGEGRNEILISKTVQGQSIALCSAHQHATTLPPKGAKV